jgi:hypothetical protein
MIVVLVLLVVPIVLVVLLAPAALVVLVARVAPSIPLGHEQQPGQPGAARSSKKQP